MNSRMAELWDHDVSDANGNVPAYKINNMHKLTIVSIYNYYLPNILVLCTIVNNKNCILY